VERVSDADSSGTTGPPRNDDDGDDGLATNANPVHSSLVRAWHSLAEATGLSVGALNSRCSI